MINSVFLNIPYDTAFEDLYLAYIVGLTQLGLGVNATLAVPNQDRLETIIRLIETSSVSIHDLSRIEASHGVPRFNMPVELGLALYRSRVTNVSTAYSSSKANAIGHSDPPVMSTKSIRISTTEPPKGSWEPRAISSGSQATPPRFRRCLPATAP